LKRIGLAGNPNSGKTTIFNQLTGLSQKTGNYPGITTQISKGWMKGTSDEKIRILDLPGAYSLYPNTSDEEELLRLILHPKDVRILDLVVYVADITQLDKQLLLLTQLLDTGIPCVLLLNMADRLKAHQSDLIKQILEKRFNIRVFVHSAWEKDKIQALKEWISTNTDEATHSLPDAIYELNQEELAIIGNSELVTAEMPMYKKLLFVHHSKLKDLPAIRQKLPLRQDKRDLIRMQIGETLRRYEILDGLEREMQKVLFHKRESRSDKFDKLFTHRFFGPIIFILLLLFIFQAIYAWSEIPMGMIDNLFSFLGEQLRIAIPAGRLQDFLINGVLAGLNGILVFVPQIALLFFLIGCMEESGYMARAVFLFDYLMKKFGLSGKSIISLMSAGACAIPAVMSARTIENKVERLITILVAPFVSCSARIPVYTILIGLAIPAITVAGIFDLRALVFTSLYLISIITALIAGLILKFLFKRDKERTLLIEFPSYRVPKLSNLLQLMYVKTRTFVIEAGKIILIISMILWFMGSYGPGKSMQNAENQARTEALAQNLSIDETEALIASFRLEASFAGKLGHQLEPLIEPLGYDWKIGIALLASFAAREVFVGTLATLYSMKNTDDHLGLQDKLKAELHPEHGRKVFNFATSISLIIFFIFSMQCMSTLAIVKRETNTWKWPIIQFFVMGILAYFAAFGTYQLLS
jgi:ferrous iron transport protein B